MNNTNKSLIFWGTRGSIPSFHATKAKYGVNTSCISIELNDDTLLIIDAGSGLHECGKAIFEKYKKIYMLLSHPHWDHIIGLPFFQPFSSNFSNSYIYTPHHVSPQNIFNTLFNGINFPITTADILYPPIILDSLEIPQTPITFLKTITLVRHIHLDLMLIISLFAIVQIMS